MVTKGDMIAAASAGIATLCPKWAGAWTLISAGQYAAEKIAPQPNKLFYCAVSKDEELGPLTHEQSVVAIKIFDAVVYASPWLLARPLIRKAPKPIAMLLGAGAMLGWRQGLGKLNEQILAKTAATDPAHEGAASAE